MTEMQEYLREAEQLQDSLYAPPLFLGYSIYPEVNDINRRAEKINRETREIQSNSIDSLMSIWAMKYDAMLNR